MCLYKKRILNPRYLPNKKNNHMPPKCTDERFRYIEAECGKCAECRKKRSREWGVRLMEEIKDKWAYFITLTIDNEQMEQLRIDARIKEVKKNENAIAKLAFRRFLERVRKETGKSLKHWAVTELGEKNDRIHIHGIFIAHRAQELTEKHWKYGMTFTGKYVNERTINYITKYMTKVDISHPWFTGKVLTSAGIGQNYTEKKNTQTRFKGKETKDVYTTRTGRQIAMPAYYKRKLYTDEQREIIWGAKMEKSYMFIHGERVSKEDEFTIQNLTEYYRRLCRQDMFDNPIEWENRKRENKWARKREGYAKIRKQMQKDAIKTGQIRESVLINRKLREKNDEIHCNIKNYLISLQRNQKQRTIKNLTLW